MTSSEPADLSGGTELQEIPPGPGPQEVQDNLTRLTAEQAMTEDELARARIDEAADARADDRWDEEAGLRRPVRATPHYWKGADWTQEEKDALYAAYASLAFGTVVTAGTMAMAVLNTLSADESAQAADDQLAVTNSTSPVDQHRETAADYTLGAQLAYSVTMGLAGLSAFTLGVQKYWSIVAEHEAKVGKLNDNAQGKRRLGLERHLAALTARIEAEQARLNDLLGQDQ